MALAQSRPANVRYSPDSIESAIQLLREPIPQSQRIDPFATAQIQSLARNSKLFVKLGIVHSSQEFEILKRINEIIPENSARPLGKISNAHGHTVGYYMQRVGAETLRAELRHSLISNDFSTRLNELVESLHKNETAHGDLHAANILVKNNEPILIDPGTAELAISKELDLLHVKELSEEIRLSNIRLSQVE